MARMIPPRPGPTTTSKAELRLFQRIKSELSDDWVALHSVGLAGHATKRWAEADFVLVGPTGVFCIEVKGGRVKRLDGIWRFTDAAGRSNDKREGPYEQAAGTEATLRRHLQASHVERTAKGRVACGWAVAFPDIPFTEEGPDILPECTFDERDADRPFGDFVDRISRYWNQRLEAIWGYSPVTLDPDDVARIVAVVRPDFDLRPGVRSRSRTAAAELLRLTAEQSSVLDALRDAERVILRGSAGTGKTFLAVEECRRLSDLGRTALFVCFNVRLAAVVRAELSELPGVSVSHLHGLMRAIATDAGRLGELPDADTSFINEVALPQLAAAVLTDEGSSGRYDALVIDEAQDLLRPEYLAVLGKLVTGGLEGGVWRAFLDPKQNAFGGHVGVGLRALTEAGGFPYNLTVNCRNTEAIATTTAMLTGTTLDELLSCDGPPVAERTYANRDEQRRMLASILPKLLRDGFAPEGITVLSRYKRSNSSLAQDLPEPVCPIVDQPRVGAVEFSTVSAFKGLENDVVILVDVDDLASAEALRSVYIGASRARTILFVLRHHSTEADRLALAEDFGRRLAAAGQ